MIVRGLAQSKNRSQDSQMEKLNTEPIKRDDQIDPKLLNRLLSQGTGDETELALLFGFPPESFEPVEQRTR